MCKTHRMRVLSATSWSYISLSQLRMNTCTSCGSTRGAYVSSIQGQSVVNPRSVRAPRVGQYVNLHRVNLWSIRAPPAGENELTTLTR